MCRPTKDEGQVRGQLRWYVTRLDAELVRYLIARMEGCGFTLAHPVTRLVTMLDDAGRVSVDRAAVPHLMTEEALGPSSDLLFWLSEDVNVIVSVYHQDVPVIELDLDGLNPDESFRVMSALLLVTAARPESVLLVGDQWLEDRVEQWDDAVRRRRLPPPLPADLLWLPGTAATATLRLARDDWVFGAMQDL